MRDFPPVTVLICTYARPIELRITSHALQENLQYSGELKFVICDDSSPAPYKEMIAEMMPGSTYVSTSQRGSGWGVNVNNGLAQIKSEYTLFLEDDYALKRSLDLNVGVALLEARTNIGMLRYRGTAGEHLVYHQFEADISSWVPDYHDGLGLPGKLNYLQLDSGSPSLYIYSNGPHLKRRSFHNFYGSYSTGLKLGATEETYAHQVKDRMKLPGAPAIAILPEWVSMHWDHIGQSYQNTDQDKGSTK